MRSFIILAALTATALGQTRERQYQGFQEQASFLLLPDVTLHVRASKFRPEDHKIERFTIWADWQGVGLIDGKQVFGTDWSMPHTQLIAAHVEIGGKTIPLDVSCLFNPWVDIPSKDQFSCTPVEGGYKIRGGFSDGAGSYSVEWRIVRDHSVRLCINQ